MGIKCNFTLFTRSVSSALNFKIFHYIKKIKVYSFQLSILASGEEVKGDRAIKEPSEQEEQYHIATVTRVEADFEKTVLKF